MNPELEIELIERFVHKEKRDRLKTFAANTKTRDKMIRELNSPGIFNPNVVNEIAGADRTVEQLLREYRKNGMGDVVYIVSENDEWDGREMAIEKNPEQCVAMHMDVLGYCKESKTGFYEWHHSGASHLFAAKNAG